MTSLVDRAQGTAFMFPIQLKNQLKKKTMELGFRGDQIISFTKGTLTKETVTYTCSQSPF